MADLGFIGLGNIGAAIASNLLEDGHALTVHDTDTSRADSLQERGATAVATPAEVAAVSEITFTSLPTPAIVEQVAAAWADGATANSILVDLSTNAPATVRAIGQALAARGCHLLEAPLTGGAPGAQMRMLVFMVGGDAATFERCEPLLARLGRATFHVGALGLGSTAKLINSLMAFSATWVSLEGLAIANKSGIATRTMIEIIRAAGTGNIFTDRMVEGINERGRATQFALSLAAKDAGLLVDVAREYGVPVPVAAGIAQALVSAVGAGLGERDFTDLVELIERQAGVELRIEPEKA